MKLSKKGKDQPNKSTPSLLFPFCCPQPTPLPPNQQPLAKKNAKFIKVTLLNLTPESRLYTPPPPNSQEKIQAQQADTIQVHEFEADKSDFLSIIRKFNPNPQTDKQEHGQTKTLQSSKQFSSSLRSGENNLSSLLQSLSNDMFSEMFVSSTIKGKILLSGSLGSISQVKSDMEISCPTESLVYGLHFTEEN